MSTKVVVHVGTRKSGTSYVQKVLRDSAPQLAEQGVDLTYKRWIGHREQQLAPLRRMAETGDDTGARENVAWMVERFSSMPDITHVLTLEDLAELPPEVADLYMGGLAGFDLHLVVTARHWGVVLPSEWQQNVKERYTGTYTDYLAAVRERRGPEADAFLARQDLPSILTRWGHLLPPERVHVLVVPPRPANKDLPLEMFCGLVGLDPAPLFKPRGAINESLGQDQAEMLRRINVALGDRLPNKDGDYATGVREWLTRQTLMRSSRSKVLLPPDYLGWCREESERQRAAAEAYHVVGDAADLLVPEDLPTADPAVADAAVAQQAVSTLADLAVVHSHEAEEVREQLRALRAERDELAARLALPRSVELARRAVRRLRRG